jgi:hypothetical protein
MKPCNGSPPARLGADEGEVVRGNGRSERSENKAAAPVPSGHRGHAAGDKKDRAWRAYCGAAFKALTGKGMAALFIIILRY